MRVELPQLQAHLIPLDLSKKEIQSEGVPQPRGSLKNYGPRRFLLPLKCNMTSNSNVPHPTPANYTRRLTFEFDQKVEII